MPTPAEQQLYSRFKIAYEMHEKAVWEMEKVMARLHQAKNENRKDQKREEKMDEMQKAVQKELENIQNLVLEIKKTLGSPNEFMGEIVGVDGVSAVIRQKIEKEAIKKADISFPYTFRTALLNAFLEREKQNRASVYKKYLHKGMRGSINDVIEEERKKSEVYRNELLEKHPDLLSPADVELFNLAFKRRMARHGEEAI